MKGQGSQLGSSYVLGELIARGPSGEVWRATDRASAGPVAIKVLNAGVAGDPELVSRFVAERSLLLGLRHPNLVRVRDLVAEGGILAIVTDLVPGEGLHALLQRTGPLEARVACGLLSGVARALATVHAGGIVHGDIKPSNVLVNTRSTPPVALLTDLGIATILRAVPGTAEYSAPELATGARPTPAADLYACGTILYEAVTGEPPFRGKDPYQTLQAHVEQTAARPRGLPDDVWAVMSSLLAKWPGSRPGAEEAALQLTALAGGRAPALSLAPPIPALRAPAPVVPVQATTPSPPSPAPVTPQQAPPPGPPVATPAPCPASMPPPAIPPAPRDPTRGPGRHLVPLIAGAVVILAAVVATAVIPGRGGGGAAATYRFPVQVAAGSASVQRSWTLTPAGTLTEQLSIANPSATTTGVTYDEVIPKSIASRAGAVTFKPQPQQVVQADPVVRYAFPALAPGASEQVAFTAHVASTAAPATRLTALAADQRAAEQAYRMQGTTPAPMLASLSVTPPSLTLPAGQSATITVAGTMSDGSPAPLAALEGITWTAAPAGIGRLTGQELGQAAATTVVATAPGRAHFTATAGPATGGFDLVVPAPTPTATATASLKPSPPKASAPAAPVARPTPSPSPDQAFPACEQLPPSPQPAPVTGTTNGVYLYRLCNPKTGLRAYTTSAAKANQDLAAGDVPEGILALLSSTTAPNAVTLYALQDAQGRQYIAASGQRISQLAAQAGAQVVGTLGYTAPSTGGPGSLTVPLYELGSNRYGSIYTVDPHERAQLIIAGWKDLGVVAYVP